jgi:hypothetical protein
MTQCRVALGPPGTAGCAGTENERRPTLKEEDIMFCPKCWAEYPKDFIECNVCKVPLTEENPKTSEHEHHHKPAPEKPSQPEPEKKKQ